MPQRDLHEGFRDPRRAPAGELVEFLGAADRLPGIRAVQRALRRALDPHPGMRLLDAGCGAGLETARLAADHPNTLGEHGGIGGWRPGKAARQPS